VLGHGFRERVPAPDALQQIADDGAQARAGGQFLEDDERAIERQPGLDQGRELLEQREDLDAADATPAEGGHCQPEGGPALVLGLDVDGEVGVPLQALDDAARVGRLHDAVDGLPLPVRGPVCEGRHAGVNLPE
jgi:hypothetical protein